MNIINTKIIVISYGISQRFQIIMNKCCMHTSVRIFYSSHYKYTLNLTFCSSICRLYKSRSTENRS